MSDGWSNSYDEFRAIRVHGEKPPISGSCFLYGPWSHSLTSEDSTSSQMIFWLREGEIHCMRHPVFGQAPSTLQNRRRSGAALVAKNTLETYLPRSKS
ncbi:hypothetical protein AVEN_255434-1 [Araneus ventricosus]|uniref:Uncharacterized protein n=1 Tax=Araneus ventricosus TaxID=182803 RepID=A0A4Y2HNT8_ARAVE|nr:hypothetical protein AVEN_255434-1 [Araneus ventricosus]